MAYTGALPDPPETWPNPAATEVFRATYDAGGVRASAWDFWKGQHNYTWSAFGIVHDTNTNRTFTPGLAQRRGDPAEDKFIHADHIGSTRWLSKMDGTFPNGLRYTAYGQKAWQTGGDWQPVDFLFAGESGYITEYSDEQNPGVALLYLQQRYYDPDVGRFLTPDPIGFAGGLNLYAYCGNDPVNNVDPSGLCQQCATGKAGGLDLSCNDYWPPIGGNKVPGGCGRSGGSRAGRGAAVGAAPRGGGGFVARTGATLRATGRAVVAFFTRPPASVRPTAVSGFRGGQMGQVKGGIREFWVAYLVGGKVGGPKIMQSNVDVTGPKGEWVQVGGPQKAADLTKLENEIGKVRAAARKVGAEVYYAFEEGTPEAAIQRAERMLGKDHVFLFPPLP